MIKEVFKNERKAKKRAKDLNEIADLDTRYRVTAYRIERRINT